MVVNAYGRPLCKHARRSNDASSPYYRSGDRYCHWWCYWRSVTLWFLLPSAIVITVLLLTVPPSLMDGLQTGPVFH